MNYTFPNQIIGFGMIYSDNILLSIFYCHTINSIVDFKGCIICPRGGNHWKFRWKNASCYTIVKDDFFTNEMVQTEFLDGILIRWN